MLDVLSHLFISDRQKADSEEEEGEALFRRYAIDTGKKYGEGGYGATYPAMDNATKEPLAVKVIDTRRMKLASIERECGFLTSLDHPNVIKIKAHGLGRKSTGHGHLYYIFMELAGGGELFDQVIDRGAHAMPEEVAQRFMVQLVAGVLHCHERGVAHRDLKLENVLLTKEGVVKVIDFGLSHCYPRNADGTIDTRARLKDVCGSKSYAAPEVLMGGGYDGFAADVWSLGVSLFAMLSGFFPLDEASAHDWRFVKLRFAQLKDESTTAVVFGWYKRSTAHLSAAAVGLLDGMLRIDPARRLTLEQVLVHPWLRAAMGSAEVVEELQLPARLLPLPSSAAYPEPATHQAKAADGDMILRAAYELSGTSLPADQGRYNSRNLIDFDTEGPTYKGLSIPDGPGSCDTCFSMEADEVLEHEGVHVYRSLGAEQPPQPPADEPLPSVQLPTLARQRAFSHR